MSAEKYEGFIQDASKRHGVSQDLLKSLIEQESNFRQFDKNGNTLNPGTSSALGLTQMIPKWNPEYDPELLANDPEYNIHAGAHKLRGLIDKANPALEQGQKEIWALGRYYGSKDPSENKNYAHSVMGKRDKYLGNETEALPDNLPKIEGLSPTEVAWYLQDKKKRDAQSAQEKPKEEQGRFGAALTRGVKGLEQAGQGVVTGVESLLGYDEDVQKRLEAQHAQDALNAAAEAKGPKASSFQEIEDTAKNEGVWAALKKIPGYVGEKIVESAPSTAGPLAVGLAAGAVSGGTLAIPAGIVASIVQEFGSMIDEQMDAAKTAGDLDPAKAITPAILAGTLDAVADRFTLGMKIPGMGRAVKDAAAQEINKSFGGELLKHTGRGLITEGPTEGLQRELERYAAGKPLTGEENWADVKESVAGGAAAGGGAATVMGAPQAYVAASDAKQAREDLAADAMAVADGDVELDAEKFKNYGPAMARALAQNNEGMSTQEAFELLQSRVGVPVTTVADEDYVSTTTPEAVTPTTEAIVPEAVVPEAEAVVPEAVAPTTEAVAPITEDETTTPEAPKYSVAQEPTPETKVEQPSKISDNYPNATAAQKERLDMTNKEAAERSAKLTEGAKQIERGEITNEDYQKLVDENKPVTAYNYVPKAATNEEMGPALEKQKQGKFEKLNAPIDEGKKVNVRLDIPSYTQSNTWIPTIHEGSKTIAHRSTAIINNVTMKLKEIPALAIATKKRVIENRATGKTKETTKTPIATMQGDWENHTPEQAEAEAKQAMDEYNKGEGDWRQVGMDPERHSYFYDRETQEPITSADRVIQIGALVLAKNAQRGAKAKNEYMYSAAPTESTTGYTAEKLKRTLTPEMRRLVETGKAVIHDTQATLPGENHPANVQGMTTADGVTHYVANKLTPTTVQNVALHEAGVHAGMEKMLGAKVWEDVKNQAMTNQGKEFDAARAAVPKNTPANLRAEETLAYLVENSRHLPLVRRIIAAIRNYMRTTFGMNIKLTEADARQLAVAALRNEANTAERSARDKGTAFSFAGEKAKTANIGALKDAQKSLTLGENSEKVRQDTGWHKEKDGKWRFEINDQDSKLKKSLFGKDFIGKTKNLSDILDHSELFKAYPYLKKAYTRITIDPNMENESGSHRTNGIDTLIKVSAKNIEKARSILIHEIQHSIQEHEGFSSGASPEKSLTLKERTHYNNIKEELAVLTKKFNIVKDEIVSKYPKRADGEVSKEFKDLEKIADNMHKNQTIIKNYNNLQWDRYTKSHGEVEARNTQERLSFSNKQRKETSPEETADVRSELRNIFTDNIDSENTSYSIKQTFEDELDSFKQQADTASDKVLPAFLSIFSASGNYELGAKYLKGGKAVLKFTRELSGMRDKMLTEMANMRKNSFNPYIKKNHKQLKLLGDVQSETTLLGVSPRAKVGEEGNIRDKIAKLEQERPKGFAQLIHRLQTLQINYAKLNPDGKRVYGEMADYYKKSMKDYIAAYEHSINTSGIDADIIKKQLAVFKDQVKNIEGKGDYFPLMRFGKYGVAYTDGDLDPDTGKPIKKFTKFDTSAEAKKFLADAKVNGYIVPDIKQFNKEIIGDNKSMMDLYEQIDKSFESTPDESKEGLKDFVFQMHLMGKSDQSIGKQFIHRKGTAGYSNDVFRAFDSYAMNMSRQLPRIKLGRSITTGLLDIKKNLHGEIMRGEFKDDVVKANSYYEAFNREILDALHPKLTGPISNFATGAAFSYYLTSPASALLQLSSIAIQGIPSIGKTHGYLLAHAAMNAATKLYLGSGVGKNVGFWNMQRGAELYAKKHGGYKKLIGNATHADQFDIAEACKSFLNEGIITSGVHAEAFSGKGRTTGAHENVMQKATNLMATMSQPFAEMESASRQIVATASYIANMKSGMTHDQAVEKAIDSVYLDMGDFGSTGRATLTKGDVGRVVWQFQQYGAKLLFSMGKSALNLASKNGQDRKEAVKHLTGLMAMHWLFAGALGLPAAGLIGGANDLIKDLLTDDEWHNYKADFRSYLEAKDVNASFINILLDGPLSTILDLKLSQRLGAHEIIPMIHESETHDTLDVSVKDRLFETFGGAAGSLAVNVADGLKLFAKGDTERAIEKLVPSALVKNLMVAGRFATEGKINAKGDQVIPKEAFTPWDIGKQAFGIAPYKVMQGEEIARSAKTDVSFAANKRSELMNEYLKIEEANGDLTNIDNKIDAYNEKYTYAPILGKHIRQSRKASQKAKDDSIFGFNFGKGREAMEEKYQGMLRDKDYDNLDENED